MSTPSIRPITSGDLLAEASSEGREMQVRLRGSAEFGSKAVLDEFFADVFAASSECREVIVDILGLEYMNSSSFKSLLTWIVRVQDLPAERKHKIRFLSNPELHWQKRSLHSLASMAGDLVEVEERAETP